MFIKLQINQCLGYNMDASAFSRLAEAQELAEADRVRKAAEDERQEEIQQKQRQYRRISRNIRYLLFVLR